MMNYIIKGTYSDTTTYYKYNVVTYDKKEYVCINDNSGSGIVGISITNYNYWSTFDPLIEVVKSKYTKEDIESQSPNIIAAYNVFYDYKKTKILIPNLNKIEVPTEKDYDRGYMYRYFYRQINNKKVKVREINKIEYKKIRNYFLYDAIKIKWKLIGPKEKAKSINENIIKNANNNLPGIKYTLLRDPLLYWRNIPDIVTNKIDVTDIYKSKYKSQQEEFTKFGVTSNTLHRSDYLVSDSDRYISMQLGEEHYLLTQNYVALIIEDDTFD